MACIFNAQFCLTLVQESLTHSRGGGLIRGGWGGLLKDLLNPAAAGTHSLTQSRVSSPPFPETARNHSKVRAYVPVLNRGTCFSGMTMSNSALSILVMPLAFFTETTVDLDSGQDSGRVRESGSGGARVVGQAKALFLPCSTDVLMAVSGSPIYLGVARFRDSRRFFWLP